MAPVSVPYSMTHVGPLPPNSGSLHLDGQRIADAAVGVGIHPSWNPSPLRAGNAFDARWRVELIRAVLDWSAGAVQKHPMYDTELDKTEKGFASYHIGMTFSLLWAHAVLGIDHLAHVDRVLEGVGIHTNERRPDLLGAAPDGTLYAIEAKGRSGGLDDAIRRGKRQIHESRYWFVLHGSDAIGAVVAAYFDNDGLSMRAEDPESWARRYEVTEALLRTVALEPYAEAIVREGSRPSVGLPPGYVGAELGDTGVLVALAPRVSEAIRLARTRDAYARPRATVSKRKLQAAHADGASLTDSIPGQSRYLQVAETLDLTPRPEERLDVGPYRGRVSPLGVAVLVDERWGTWE